MVHAPTQIWEMINHRNFLGATHTFLKATAIADKAQHVDPSISQVSTPEGCVSDSDPNLSEWLHGWQAQEDYRALILQQWLYVADLGLAVKEGARRLLMSQVSQRMA